MKKIILLFMASGIYLHALFAGASSRNTREKFRWGMRSEWSTLKYDKSSLQIINGVRIGTYFAAGVGVGFDYCGKSSLDSYRLGFALFGDIKGYLPVSPRPSLFLATDIGAVEASQCARRAEWGDRGSGNRRQFRLSPKRDQPESHLHLSGRERGKGRKLRAPNYNALGLKADFNFKGERIHDIILSD
ncbi:MAG: hypothetical protein ACLR8Y_11035 [Alistipes indistinctus]